MQKRTPGRSRWRLLEDSVESLTIVVMLIMICHVVLNAFARSFFNNPVEGTNEYVSFWYMPIISLIGFLLATRRHEHIEVALVVDRLPRANQIELQLLSYLVVTVLSLAFAWYSFQEALDNLAIGLTGGVTGVVVWPVTFLVPVSFALIALTVLVYAVRLIRRGQLPDEWQPGPAEQDVPSVL